MSKQWDVDAALQQLLAEKAYDGVDLQLDQAGTNDTVKRMLREAAPAAALSLIHLAQHSANESIRFKASKEILDRNLGLAGQMTSTTEKDPFRELMEGCLAATLSDNDRNQ